MFSLVYTSLLTSSKELRCSSFLSPPSTGFPAVSTLHIHVHHTSHTSHMAHRSFHTSTPHHTISHCTQSTPHNFAHTSHTFTLHTSTHTHTPHQHTYMYMYIHHIHLNLTLHTSFPNLHHHTVTHSQHSTPPHSTQSHTHTHTPHHCTHPPDERSPEAAGLVWNHAHSDH